MPSVPVMQTADGRFVTDLDADGFISAGWDWNSWEIETVTTPVTGANDVDLTVVGGRAQVTGDNGGAATNDNDRRFLLLDDTVGLDFEVRAIYALEAGLSPTDAQSGIVLRVQPDVDAGGLAPLGWNNIVFGRTGPILHGVWDYDGGPSLVTNQQPTDTLAYARAINSVTANGSTATCICAEPHQLQPSDAIEVHSTAVGGSAFIPAGLTLLDDFTFRFNTTQTGGPAPGTLAWYAWPLDAARLRRLAVRLVGRTMTSKQWPIDLPEPPWNDPVKTRTFTFPETLAGGVPFPTTPGRVGFVAAHLGDQGRVTVSDFQVDSLD